jgi:hypothetical protein
MVPILSGFVAFWLAGVIESIEPGVEGAEVCKRIGKVTLSWVLGVIGMAFLGRTAEGGE